MTASPWSGAVAGRRRKSTGRAMLQRVLDALLIGATATAVIAWLQRPIGRTRRLLRRTRVTPIAELTGDVLACVVGRVELDGDPILAPISGRVCVAYDNTVTTQDGPGLFTTTRVERRMVPFYVVDRTGRVRVLAPSAALCNPPASRSLNRHVERVIEPGMQIRIVGSVILDPAYALAAERGYRDGAVRATLTGSSKYPLLIDVA